MTGTGPGGGAMGTGIFVTGTDTGVGKTVVSVALLRALVAAGHRAVGMKPVAAGLDGAGTVHSDVRALIAAGNLEASIADVNPYSFVPPIAPHLAAAAAGVAIDVDRIVAAYLNLATRSDVVVVEGAGGALVPLAPRTDMLDIPARLCLPILLVVGVRLGCINHTLLSTLAIAARGLRLAGWVANRVDPTMAEGDANVATLAARLSAPLVADFGWREGGAIASSDTQAMPARLGLVSRSLRY